MKAKTRRQEVIPTINLPRPCGAGDGSKCDNLSYRIPDMISPAAIPNQLLSDLLWSASSFPIAWSNHSVDAPVISNGASHPIDLYLAMSDAIYFYSPHVHELVPVTYGDFRQNGVAADKLPLVQLIYVADLQRAYHNFCGELVCDPDLSKFYDGFDAGVIAGRIVQFAASHRLVTWFHWWDQERLHAALSLGPERRVLFVQAIACSTVS